MSKSAIGKKFFTTKLAIVDVVATYDCIIIGAGAAGLQAAHHLKKAELNVVILEARDRIGGRIWSDTHMAPYPIELGAEYIHDASNPTLKALLTASNATQIPEDGAVYVYADGVLTRESELQQRTSGDLLNALMHAADEHISGGGEDMSISDFLGEDGEFAAREQLSPGEVGIVNSMIASEYGVDTHRFGLRGLIECDFSGYDGTCTHIAEGYASVLAPLTDVDILFNTPVDYVWQAEDYILCRSEQTEFTAKHVICTVPLAILQNQLITFDPPLPAEKLQAIASIGSAHIVKIVLEFHEAWWPEDMAQIITSTLGQVYWRPGYGRQAERPLLTAFIGGKAAEQFEAKQTEVVVHQLIDELSHVHGKPLKPLFNSAYIMDWSNNPWSRMGYSYLPLGIDPAMRTQLATPVGNVHFAGEATMSKHAASVHGALESGLRAAKEVLTAK